MIKKKLTIKTKKQGAVINKEIYGHFSEHLGRCIYNGLFVSKDSPIPNHEGMRDDVVTALRDMGIPVLRWPGGCFADEYHWKNGIGSKEERATMINTNWGGVTEDNSFGTHEFLELCRQLECEPYICGNVGSGTVRELSEWVEYMTSSNVSPMTDLRKKNGREEPWKLKYLGIGNENWGCGGNMTPEYYASEFRRYSSFAKNYGDNRLYRIACGPNGDDYNWTEQFMKMLNPMLTDAIALHYYTICHGDWNNKGPATGFTNEDYCSTIFHTLRIEGILDKHLAIMDKYDPDHKIGLVVDEWGCWYNVEPGTNPGFLYQQNTMRDAIVAALNLNIFNNHADRIPMANIAQIVNVLQSVVLTEGAKMIKTPTYYVFSMFKPHQGSTLVESKLEDSFVKHEGGDFAELSVSASVRDNSLTVTLANASLENSYRLDSTLDAAYSCWTGRILTDNVRAFNSFDNPDEVADTTFKDCVLEDKKFTVTLPPCSVVTLTFSK